MRLTESQLQLCLTRFKGKLINGKKSTNYQRFSLWAFTDPTRISDPRVQVTMQLDITDLYAVYEKYYKETEGATFTAYMKWVLIKAMKNTPFNWRFINNQWYEFDNLPLEAAVFLKDGDGEQRVFFLYDVDESTWPEFSLKHSAISNINLKDSLDDLQELPLYTFCHAIVGVHFPRMTAYSTTAKAREEYTHQPWMVFGTRYTQEGRLYLPFYLSFSHASLIPGLAERFIRKFVALGEQPFEVEEEQLSRAKL
ncbi:MAG: hypothetical protein H0U73_00260 [Tatlockia sp.]|nr:hypothetical protein [Tatlockia sp.]